MPIDPKTGKLGKAIDVPDSYNLYFTPDGKSAIMVAEAMRRLEFRDPHTMALQGYIPTPRCAGINHADFAADGSYAIFTCEFANALAKIDLVHHTLAGMLQLTPGGMPQDIRVSPDGSVFFVADLLKDGLVLVAGDSFQQIGFIRTGVGAHGLYPSRDGTKLYVSNRGTHNIAGVKNGLGSVSVVDMFQPRVLATWTIPGGGSPDMGNLSADGKWLWLSGRYDGVDLRLQHRRRLGEDDPGRRHAARPDGVAAAGAVLARPHGEFAVAMPATISPSPACGTGSSGPRLAGAPPSSARATFSQARRRPCLTGSARGCAQRRRGRRRRAGARCSSSFTTPSFTSIE